MKLIKVMNFLGTGERKKSDVEAGLGSDMMGETVCSMPECQPV
jgi:hypothetical protein